ncbi:MAG: serine/threonine-protein kinase [Planctomycetota bacterium]|nr:serine/threonine-protein kinase [Planctomycetota bacterium]
MSDANDNILSSHPLGRPTTASQASGEASKVPSGFASDLLLAPSTAPAPDVSSIESPLQRLLAQQRNAWQSGDFVSIESLLGEHAKQSGVVFTTSDLLSLIEQEVALRLSLEQFPTLREYQQRFPRIIRELRSHWDRRELQPAENISSIGSTLPPDSSRDSLDLLVKDDRDFEPDSNTMQHEAIGRYEIRSELGRGTNGVVFEVWDPSLKRTVALKRLRAGFDANKSQLERIQSEAEAIARIHHPNIVSIYDVGSHQGLPFFAMEICRGGTLESRLAKGPIAGKQAAHLIIGIAKGVGAAHERNIIHRDLKPGNILLESHDDLSPKVTDFGLAKTIDNYAVSTWTGSIVGTPAYMSPEQAFGEAKNVNFSSDIYSIGAILYECLTGRPPLRGVTAAETLDQVKHHEPVAVKSLSPNVPRDLETITLKCLQKAPTDRYQTTNELIKDLQRFLANRPILARRTSRVELAWRWCKRNPLAASLVTCLLMLAITSISNLVVSNKMIYRETLEKARALTARERALNDRAIAYEVSQRSEELAKRNFYAAQLNLASRAFIAGEVSRAEDLLESVVPAPCDVDFRRFEWHMLNMAIHRNLRQQIDFPDGEVTSLSVSPDSKYLAVAGGKTKSGYAAIVDLIDQKIIHQFPPFKSVVYGCGYSPNGEFLALVSSDGQLNILDAKSYAIHYTEQFKHPLRSLAWSPDNKQFVAGTSNGELVHWNCSDWEHPVISESAHKGPVLRLRFSQDSLRLYSSCEWGNEGIISRAWKVDTQPFKLIADFPGFSIGDESDDGTQIAGLAWGHVKLIKLEDKSVVLEQAITPGPLVSVEFSGRPGSMLLAIRGERLLRRIDKRNLTTSDEFPVRRSISAIAQDSKGEIIISGDTGGQVRIWNMVRQRFRNSIIPKSLTFADYLTPTDDIVAGSDSGSHLVSGKKTTKTAKPFHEGKNLRAISGDRNTFLCLNRSEGSRFDNQLQIWRIGETQPINLPLEKPIYGDCLAISSSGRWLAKQSESEPLRVYDLISGEPEIVHSWDALCSSIAFSPNEKLLAGVEHGGSVCRFSVDSGERMKNLAERDSLRAWRLAVAFSEDSKLVACGNESGIVTICNAETGELVSKLIGNQGIVQSLAFFPKSERLATGVAGGVRIWDVQTGQELMTLPTNESRVMQVAVNASGDSLLAVTQDGRLYFWNCK